jgi:hypothetical protein
MVDPVSIGLAIGAIGAGSSAAGTAAGLGAAAGAGAGAAGAGLTGALGSAALGAAAAGTAGALAGKGAAASPTLSDAPAAPQQQQQPSTMAPKAKFQRPTFFGENATPAVGQFGQKTLLGQ